MDAPDRREKPASSGIQVDCLEDSAVQTRVEVFRDLVASCRGPCGKAKVIQNSVGGHVTWTKLSSRLLSVVSMKTPLLKVVVGAVQGHLERYKDGGLLTAQFCLSLVESSLKLSLPRRLLVELHEKFIYFIDEYLNSDQCGCKFEVDVFSLQQVMKVLRSMCRPKLSYLSTDVQEKMCLLFLDVFLSTIPHHRQDFCSDRVYIECFANSDISESACLKGLLLECPELSSTTQCKLDIRTTSESEGLAGKLKVALVTESMSGDSEGVVDARYEFRTGVDVDAVVLERLQDLCQRLVEVKVGLILCQRVIHPKVKVFLRQAGVVFIDRLGSCVVPYIRDLTGATPLTLLATDLIREGQGFGSLDGAVHQIRSGKSYLFLTREHQPIVTLVLKGRLEEVVQDLKVLSQSSLATLQLLLREPWVVAGGGCWSTHVAAYLVAKVREEKMEIAQELECSESHVMSSLTSFVHCLRSLATGTVRAQFHATDLKYYHIWSMDSPPSHSSQSDGSLSCERERVQSCNCRAIAGVQEFEEICGDWRLYEREIDVHHPAELEGKDVPDVVDALPVVLPAMRMAVATANTLLSISQYIHDRN